MKNKRFLFILPILCLTSCGKDSLVGKYSFMLGKEGEGETKIGLSMELTDEDFVYAKRKPVAKTVLTYEGLEGLDKSKLNDQDIIFVLSDETKGRDSNYYKYEKATDSFIDLGPTGETEITKAGKMFYANANLSGNFAEFPQELINAINKGFLGYYYETNYSDEKFGTRLNVGTVINKENIPGLEDFYTYIRTKVSEEAAELAEQLLSNLDSVIESSIVEYILCTYCDGNTITLQVPVSINDLQQQLTWYGKFIDIDDEVAQKIHSIKDFFDNILEVIGTLKTYDLEEHRTKITGKSMSEGELVKMPGIEGEGRFGTEPVVDLEKQINEVDAMNKTYANEFSNTLVYQDISGSMVPVGAITSYNKTMEGASKQMYYYYDRENKLTTSDATISGFVIAKDEFGDFREYKEVKISLVHDFTDPNLGIQIGSVSDMADKVYDYGNFYQNPFKFRSFHRLPLTLKR